ncbi:MAG: D-alanine--D-alanine ligase [Bacteroidetes bacterium CG2_30_33_31]|nr:MAG: D-alanine--D-alanine ligase [Bacteroidetes bacterium CG2_30_33_31]
MKNIAIISGGFSGERVISIESAKFVLKNLDATKYVGYQIIIEETSWYFIDENGDRFEIEKNDFSLNLPSGKIKFDRVFNIIHGDPGENGKMQAYFEILGILSTSSSSVISALTFNKAYCNKVVAGLGVNVAEEVFLNKKDKIDVKQILEHVGLPCFVKPNAGGSSIGMSKVHNAEELLPAIEMAFKEDNQVLVERFVKGREITCGLINSKGSDFVLPLCEVVSKKEFFDYEAKYNGDLAEEIIPAIVEKNFEKSIKSTSVFLYHKLNCSGVVRMDYIITEDNIFFLEVNTIPGLSSASIVPKMAKEFGWSFNELIDKILEEAN